MRSAFFVLAASIFANLASAVTPAAPSDRITATHYPAYAESKEVGGFNVAVSIVVKKAYVNDEDTGRADFKITVTFPLTADGKKGGQTVAAKCDNEEYIFVDGSIEMSPFDEGCTDDFIKAMNTAFVANGARTGPVKSPIRLPYDNKANTLEFNAIAGARFVIPASAPVKKGQIRLL
jgi:hypothetical protein